MDPPVNRRVRLVIRPRPTSVSTHVNPSPSPSSSPIFQSSVDCDDLLSFDSDKSLTSIEDFFSPSSSPVASQQSPLISTNDLISTESMFSRNFIDVAAVNPVLSMTSQISPLQTTAQLTTLVPVQNFEDLSLVRGTDHLANTELELLGGPTRQQSQLSTIIYTNLTPQEFEQKKKLEEEASSKNTTTSYEYDWKLFLTYFYAKNPTRSHTTANHEDVFSYFNSHQTELKMSTIERRIAGIAHYLNFDRAALNLSVKGLANRIGRGKEGKDPLLQEHVTSMLNVIEARCQTQKHNFNVDLRDRAFILFAFYTGARRSEISDLKWSDVVLHTGSMTIRIRKSKTDQQGEGQDVVVLANKDPRYCGVRALLEWKNASEYVGSVPWVWRRINKNDQIKDQLKVKQIYLLTKDYCQQIGLDPDKYSPHSFRAGMITQSKINGADLVDIMKQSRHRSVNTVMGYIRLPNLMKNNVSAGMWSQSNANC